MENDNQIMKVTMFDEFHGFRAGDKIEIDLGNGKKEYSTIISIVSGNVLELKQKPVDKIRAFLFNHFPMLFLHYIAYKFSFRMFWLRFMIKIDDIVDELIEIENQR